MQCFRYPVLIASSNHRLNTASYKEAISNLGTSKLTLSIMRDASLELIRNSGDTMYNKTL